MSSRQRLPKRGNKSIMAESEDLAVDPTTGDGRPMGGGSPSGGSFDGVDNDRFIINGLDTASASVGDMSMSGTDGASGGSAKKNDRRHRCHLCGKRFNRPSSLKIHFTTHTGERPFPCLFPGCGRAFNVSSNMRRHYRTHVSGGGDGETAPPISAPDFGAQNQQQYDQQQQQAQPWSVNMYNPSTANGQVPRRSRAKRAKGAGGQYQSQNNMDGEGSEEGEGEGSRGMGQNQNLQPYPPMGPPGMYGNFPPPPMMNMPGMPEIPGMPDLQAMQMQGIPMGVQMMPIEMAFPVDPALTAGDADMDADADADAEGDADVDADEDGDGDAEGEGEGEGDDSNRPQLTHSTSNTRASTMSAPAKTRSSARVQAKSKSSGNAKGKGKQAKANASANTGAATTPSAQQQVQFRQILVPVSVPMSGDPAQATRIAQQYQHQYAQQYAKYAQYAQYYLQSQPQGQHGQPGTPGQVQGTARQSPAQPHTAPPQASTQNDTAAQRLGPATSDERTAPSAPVQPPLQLHGPNEVVGRSVFVHWGPKEAKAKAEKQAEAYLTEQSAATQTATSAQPTDAAEGLAMLVEGLSGGTVESGGSAPANVEPTSPNGSATDNAGAAEALSALASGIVAAVASASTSEQPVKDEAANNLDASTSTPTGDVEMEVIGTAEEKGAEGEKAEEEGKPSSGSTPRKRRKVARGRGKRPVAEMK